MTTKTIMITGCSSGFGKLAAKTFQEKGWNVIATMRNPEKEKDLKPSETMLLSQLDVNDEVSIKQAVSTGLDKFGRIDVLVNNAGFGSNAMFEQASDADIRGVFETNVFGLMNVTRALLPHMRKNGSGRVINITSMAGLLGIPGNTAYCASKYAVEGLTESLAHEYRALGIQFKTIAPGAFASTAFMSNVESKVSSGDEQLQAHSESLRAHFLSQAHSGAPQDPQMVAEKIFECATEDTPIRNTVGSDADGLIAAMDGSANRHEFTEFMAKRLLPTN